MDPTLARILGILIARLLVEGWKPDQIGQWVTNVAMEIDHPTEHPSEGKSLCSYELCILHDKHDGPHDDGNGVRWNGPVHPRKSLEPFFKRKREDF